MNEELIRAALAVAKKFPVFPTANKRPCWSNKELGVGRGEGGYKSASQDPERVKELFSHRNATEIAVPMGERSGLMCVDVDLYKMPELEKWVSDRLKTLGDTLSHKTRSGGLHFFFRHPGNGYRMPATLRPGIDVKAAGNGYVCWPPTEGYAAVNKNTPRAFPEKLFEEALKEKGGTGSLRVGSSFNSATNTELIDAIQSATDLYPALRSLSYRLPTQRSDEGAYLTVEEQIDILQNVMQSSVAASASHPRNDDWNDRFGKIEELVISANEKVRGAAMNEGAAKILAEGGSFIDRERMIATPRPIGPQREPTLGDVEQLVAEASPSAFTEYTGQSLDKTKIAPISWVVPGMVPESGTLSLGGTSGVGKTRWVASLLLLGAAGKLDLMGLPSAKPFASLWLANEERVDDIGRRLKAVLRQHGLKKTLAINVRGKDAGMLRLVAINEVGTPELDLKNIALVVAEARRLGVTVIVFDPYITLSDAMDENSATSAAMLTKAFIMISTLTGAAVIHVHHTPKDRTKDADWYRADSGAWRGSGAIYSALDCGYTLAHWMPKGKEPRKKWKQEYLDKQLSRWIVLDTGKIREGRPIDPVLYELVGQALDKGEGDPIGVCRLSSEQEASKIQIDEAVGVLAVHELARALIQNLGGGNFDPQATHNAMRDVPQWDGGKGSKVQTTRYMPELLKLFGDVVQVAAGTVLLKHDKKKRTTGRWVFVIREKKP